jgi:2-isopropylmalate synthase|tara:strand:- start:560 stop:1861 length:1302 start_codon:yes stop_codon:yes gene_type:complete
VGKTWDFHVSKALNITLEENIDMISESINEINKRGKQALFDCEHFFDGFKNNKKFALECVRSAFEAGAKWVVLCDTNGGTLPHEITKIINEVNESIPGVPLGIHCHNDSGTAVACSLAAIEAGVRHVQGTINGLGERCGNADLIALIPNLMLKLNYETGIKKENLYKLKHLSRLIDDRLNRSPNLTQPYVGEAAFAHKGGLHASGVQKDSRSYEHVEPEIVGNQRSFVVSDQTGKSNIIARLKEVGLKFDVKDSRLDKLIENIKENEFKGFSYDTAEASFELMARRTLEKVPDYFVIGRFRVMDERRFNAKGDLVVESEASVTLNVGGQSFHEVAIGNGPVNAVDTALRKALTKIYPSLNSVSLVDYKVRIIDSGSGTEATTRVLIECEDDNGDRWRSVGLSTNIIDASVMALYDSLTWRLLSLGITPEAPAN